MIDWPHDLKKKIFTVGMQQKRFLTEHLRHDQSSESRPPFKMVGDLWYRLIQGYILECVNIHHFKLFCSLAVTWFVITQFFTYPSQVIAR